MPIKPGYYCSVCGDFAEHYRFNALVCLACRSFFCRMANKIDKKKVECVANGACIINIQTRTRCRFCRFKKCKAVGMTAEKCPNDLPKSNDKRAAGSMVAVEEKYEEIHQIVTRFEETYQLGLAALRAELARFHRMPKEVQAAIVYQTLVDCHYSFFCNLPAVSGLPENERRALAEYRCQDAFNIVSSLLFDQHHNCWNLNSNAVMLNLDVDARVYSVNDSNLYNREISLKRLKLMRSLLNTNVDKVALLLLLLVSCFSIAKDNCNATFCHSIKSSYDHYDDLLQCYLEQKYGPLYSKQIYDQLDMRLRRVRKLSRSMLINWRFTPGQEILSYEFMFHLRNVQHVHNNGTTKGQSENSIKFSIENLLKLK